MAVDATRAINSWRNLGLIHILVVSGGHLTILAALLSVVRPRRDENRLAKKIHTAFVGLILILFCLANELQPPVLRALLEWMLRKPFQRRGWRTPETALMATWFALPFSSSIYDLLSLALSFFASVTVEQTARRLHSHKWLQAVAIQHGVWWVLLPLLFTMGVPHPLTSMSNIVLAPMLGATVIPLAMITWLSGAFPNFSGTADDPIGLGYAFDFGWEKLNFALVHLADFLPQASPRINGAKPLIFGIEITIALLIAIAAATAALLVRSRREPRRQHLARSQIPTWLFLVAAFAASLFVHAQL